MKFEDIKEGMKFTFRCGIIETVDVVKEDYFVTRTEAGALLFWAKSSEEDRILLERAEEVEPEPEYLYEFLICIDGNWVFPQYNILRTKSDIENGFKHYELLRKFKRVNGGLEEVKD